jgi:NadR type nicotinamide-nucleotide adenylyltransferase
MAAGGIARRGTRVTPQLICIAGAESTGKSWLAHRLAAHFGIGHVTEYARAFCAEHGNALTLDQLTHVGKQQDAMIRAALTDAAATGLALVIADTDALVTGVWARVSHRAVPDWFTGDLAQADLTLVTENDLPWRDDGLRIQNDDAVRDYFHAALINTLDKAGRRWASVGGTGDVRLTNALAAIEAHLPPC